VYVGRKYTASQTKAFERDFRCRRCGFEAPVIVVGVGQGSGNSPYFTDEEGARERAHQGAQRAAERNADLIVDLAPCERCGHRNGLANFWTMNVVGALGIAFGCALLVALVGSFRAQSIAIWIYLGGALALGVAGYLRWIDLSTASRRVAVVGDADEDVEPRPKTRKKKKRKKPTPDRAVERLD
jgi:hypothetical protein